MAEVDAKVNMSLDDIIKMEKKEKKKMALAAKGKIGVGGAKRNTHNPRGATRTGNNVRAGALQNRKVVKRSRANMTLIKRRRLQLQQSQNIAANTSLVVAKRFNKKRNKTKNNNLTVVGNGRLGRSRSNNVLNRIMNNNNNGNNSNAVNARGNFGQRRGVAGDIARNKNRGNLITATAVKRFFVNKGGALKRTNSMPNLRDPNSVHNRLGYQSPAQIAYRNRVNRAKQLLLQRQNQRMQMANDYRVSHNGKTMSILQQRALSERRQQMLTPQRNFTNVGLRSDQILRAQRRAQYAQKLMRINALRMNPNHVNFMNTVGNDYVSTAGVRQRSMSLTQIQNRDTLNRGRQLARGRSPFRPNPQHLTSQHLPSMMIRQRCSRSRSRSRNIPIVQLGGTGDDRTFSEIMHSLTIGVTGRTLNDRFSS